MPVEFNEAGSPILFKIDNNWRIIRPDRYNFTVEHRKTVISKRGPTKGKKKKVWVQWAHHGRMIDALRYLVKHGHGDDEFAEQVSEYKDRLDEWSERVAREVKKQFSDLLNQFPDIASQKPTTSKPEQKAVPSKPSAVPKKASPTTPEGKPGRVLKKKSGRVLKKRQKP